LRGFIPYFFLAPRYNLVTYLKAEFVLNASLVNPFNSSHFFWIDGGYGHGLPNIWPPHKGKRWPDPDKVRIRILLFSAPRHLDRSRLCSHSPTFVL
jgi:hypothetical protein